AEGVGMGGGEISERFGLTQGGDNPVTHSKRRFDERTSQATTGPCDEPHSGRGVLGRHHDDSLLCRHLRDASASGLSSGEAATSLSQNPQPNHYPRLSTRVT